MIRKINTTISLIILSLSLGLVSCKNDIKVTKYDQSANREAQTLAENNTNIVDSPFDYEISKDEFNKIENDYNVHGTDEEGNKVSGTINIDGKVGIGMIRGNEAKGIEIVAEWIGTNILTATDLKGYEYQLVVDAN